MFTFCSFSEHVSLVPASGQTTPACPVPGPEVTFAPPIGWYKAGQIFLLGGHFEKAAFSREPHLLVEVKASLS